MPPPPLCEKVVLAHLLPTVGGGTGRRGSLGRALELGAGAVGAWHGEKGDGAETEATEERQVAGLTVFSEPGSSESRGHILVQGMALLIASEPSSSKNHMAPVCSACSSNQTPPNIRLLYFWSHHVEL
jgi:hypothetical protein